MADLESHARLETRSAEFSDIADKLEVAILRQQNKDLRQLKDQDQVAELAPAGSDSNQFIELRSRVQKASGELQDLAGKALRSATQYGDGMPYPKWQSDEADRAISEGHVSYDEDRNQLYLNMKVIVVTMQSKPLKH